MNMNKQDFNRSIKQILVQVRSLKANLDNCEIVTISEDMEMLKDEAEETIENIRSEELKDQWQERVDALDDIVSRIDDIKEVFDNMEDLITDLENLEE